MNPIVRLGASILALTALGGCAFHMGGGAQAAPQGETVVDHETSSPADAEATPAAPSKDRPSWVPAHWEEQGRNKTWVDGHWG